MTAKDPKPPTAIQIRAARLLARGATGKATAEALDVAPETVSRWRKDPVFIAEIRRAAELARDGDPRARVDALTPRALDVLGDLLNNAKADPAVRVRAAAALLGFAAAIREPSEEATPEP